MALLWHYGYGGALKTPLCVGVTHYLLGSQQLTSVVSEDSGIQHTEGWDLVWQKRSFAGEKGERRCLGVRWPPSATGLPMRKHTGSFRERKRARA